MIVLNFAHPATDEQVAEIARLSGRPVERVVDVPAQFDHARPFAEQAAALIDRAGLTPAEWGGVPVVVNLPSFSPGAAAVLAELHGRTGHFPTVVRLRPVAGSSPTRYEVAELVNLQETRDAARTRRI